MASHGRETFFVDAPDGGRHALLSLPAGPPRAALLFVPPLAEELNKSRRMVALAAAALAGEGVAVLQIDLRGCGDSAGDHGDAGWYDWLDDLDRAWAWMDDRGLPMARGLWTLRAGSLLAADWLVRRRIEVPLMMWQPVFDGAACLGRFLRLKAAAGLLAEGQTEAAAGSVAALRAELAAGRSVELAGYMLSPALAAGLGGARWRLPAHWRAPLGILELSSAQPPRLQPASLLEVERLRAAGVAVSGEALAGPAFWQTSEIEVVPALVEASCARVRGLLP